MAVPESGQPDVAATEAAPAANPVDRGERRQRLKAGATGAHGPRILLIDGNDDDRRTIEGELAELHGQMFDVTVATTLADGLAELRHGHFNVILLDLNLGDSVGLTTYLRLQPKAGDVPVIVLVGKADEDLGAGAVERGALDFLIKQQVVSTILDKTLRYATERTHTLRALKASETRYRELYENVVAGVFQSTQDGKFMSCNPALVRLLGYASEDEMLGIDIARDLFMYPEDRENWRQSMEAQGEIRNAELVLKRKDGHKIVVLENSRAVRDEQNRVLYYEGTLTDITEAHELSRQLSYEASHDALTGLINRREFELQLQRALESVQATNTRHAVFYIDLDQFKLINDTCGHIAGDELLRQLAATLNDKIRTGDTLARLGGDEFGMLLHDCAVEDAVEVARTLLKVIEQFQFVWGSSTFFVGASIGVVPVDQHFRRITQVLAAADTACYAAKDQGRHRVHVYREEDHHIARRHGEMQWVSRVKRALVENRFVLDAQRIEPLNGGRRLIEVLVRMRDENGRLVPPGAFFPAVERFNLASRLDRWVITATFDWLRRNRSSLENVERCFINLAADSLGDPQVRDLVMKGLTAAGIPGSLVGFEITEAAAVTNLTRANQLISELKPLGCAFALDDFGTGVSSFAYLKALAVDYMKIDGMFVGNIATDAVDLEMVRSIHQIGRVMGKKTIAECVEQPAVLAKLKEIGVDYAQGFIVAQPESIDQLVLK
ncbi:MAG TPA: EAL domain-containing protein [Steroidobacteraceae bacterium]|nr:EAL domain-containing protein [Steroidobacteraceae bacterium]